MTVMAVSPQARAGTGTAPAKAAGARRAKPVPPAAADRRPQQIVLGPVRDSTAKSLLRLAAEMAKVHPEMTTHRHLLDAADQVRIGNEEGALRHLRAAAYGLQPQSLRRHGVHDDGGHVAARQALEGVVRHHLLVRDIQDADARNREAIARQAVEDAYGSPPPPSYGGDPGALAQRPVARQPGGDRALNAPPKTNAGRVDPAVADPVGPQPRGSKQFARSWDEVAAVIDLATVSVRAYKRTVQTRNGPRAEVVRASTRQPAAKAAEDEEEDAAKSTVNRSHIRGYIPEAKWKAGQAEWVARGKTARAAKEAAEAQSPKVPEAAKPPSLADVIDEHAREFSARGTGRNHERVGYQMGQAADALRAGDRQAALAHLGAARMSGAGTGGAGAGAVHARGLGSARDVIGKHIEAVRSAKLKRPNTVIDADPQTGELREMTQKEVAEAAGRYATTLRPGSAERGEVMRQAMDIARGGPAWQRMKEDSDPLRAMVTKEAPGDAPGPAGAIRAERAAAKTEAARTARTARRALAGSDAKAGLLSERMAGDKTSGEMSAGDWQEGYQAVGQAPTGILGNDTHREIGGHLVRGSFSDGWWMAKPGGGWAISRRWRSKPQDSYSWHDGKSTTTHIPAQDIRVLTPVSSKGIALARTWDELAAVIDLSARTPMLSVTPAPYGRPGGPGLYRLKGNAHSPYYEQVVQALMRKRGMSKAQASAVAWGALRHWAAGRNTARKGHVTPVVQAAAGRALGQEAAAAAKARAAHGHAVTWDDLGAVVELAVVDVRTYQRTVNTARGPVVETITQHQQNYKSGQGAPAAAPRQQKPKTAPKTKKTAPKTKASQKAQLLADAKGDRQRAAILGVQRAEYEYALINALYGSNTTAAQSGATTSAQTGSTTAAQAGSTTAATAGTTTGTAGATAASGASQQVATAYAALTAAIAAAGQSGASGAAIQAAQAQAQQAAAGMTTAQLGSAVNSLKAQITALNTLAAKLTAQAAKL
jgi:hypothetical protein